MQYLRQVDEELLHYIFETNQANLQSRMLVDQENAPNVI